MEEDIKILKEMMKEVKEEAISYDKYCYEVEVKQIQALENLLTRYKQLERENQSYKDYYGNPPCYDDAKYISKSKVKEKIEELKKQYKDYSSKWEKSGRDKAHPFYRYLVRIEAEIDILQELLREE